MPQQSPVAFADKHYALKQQRNWTRALFPALLLTLYVAQCLWFIRTQSLTYDEPVHIAEGLNAWHNGQFEEYNDHPPLARLLCTLPLIGREWQVEVEKLPAGFRVHRIAPDPVSLAWRARAMNVALGLLLGILLWLQAAKMFSAVAANFSLALFAFSPSLIAHFSVVTTDGAATLLIFAASVQIVRWNQKPTWRSALASGIVFGLLLLAKFSTLPMFALAMVWILVLVRGFPTFHPLRWNYAKAALALLIAILVVWAGYFFHISRLTIRDGTLTVTHPHWTAPLVKPTHSRLNVSLLIPAGEFVAGLRDVALRNAHGQPAFFLGQVSQTGGWKAYYPVTILLKWPLIVIVLAAAGFALCLFGRIRAPGFLIMASFPALYLGLAIFAHFNIGERHVLPLYPFALVFASAVWQRLSQLRFGTAVLIAMLVLNAADVLRYAPDYLSYFDIFVSPQNGFRLLADSNLDWGQGLLALRKYQVEHPREQISLAYFGSVDPAIYGINARLLNENEHATGTVIISATHLAGEYLKDQTAYQWLLHYRRVRILDHSLYVFSVDR
jgi:4-amino-4-deoxy-L-arabinose transferase-like glycosyltransferase